MTLSLYMKRGGGDAIVITRHTGLSQALLEDGELAVGT